MCASDLSGHNLKIPRPEIKNSPQNKIRKRIGIYSGSFNPIHCGHLMLAEYIASSGVVDEVWMLVTPLNPLKQYEPIESNAHRYAMVEIAAEKSKGVNASDFEFSLPLPTYTFNTLCELQKKHPEYKFTLIIGSDNWLIFDRWRDSNRIITEFGLIIYPRPGYYVDESSLPENVLLLTDAPVAEISSTEIRRAIELGKKTDDLLPPDVASYIRSHHLYE